MWQHALVVTLIGTSLAAASPSALFKENNKEVVRRQVLGAPLYSPCGPGMGCAAPGMCQASMCMPVAAPLPAYAAPMPAPLPVAPVAMPAFAPPPPPAFAPACAPACAAPAACIGGACACPGAAMYAPGIGCAAPLPPAPPVPALAPPPPPPPAGRLIPQALPGAPCEPGVECTGGSVCSMGICLCPPELVQEGTVCVARTLYGPVAPPPPLPAAYPVPVRPAFVDPCGGIHKRSADGVGCANQS